MDQILYDPSMSTTVLITFIGTCVLLAVTPGPNMALIIANTFAGGLRGGLATLVGTTSGLAILVGVVALGMTSIMVLMAEWFDVVRWVGAVYLALLGALQLRAFWRRRNLPDSAPIPLVRTNAGGLYLQGLFVSLSNPKVLLFLGAFLPQFVDVGRDPGPQLALLAALFVAILALVDIAYTIVLARARATIAPSRLAILDGGSGLLLLAGGLALVTLRRP
jgi:homoserine/homoserine lactone efflux protein